MAVLTPSLERGKKKKKIEEMSIKTVLELVFCPMYLSQLRRVGFTHLVPSQTHSHGWIEVVSVRGPCPPSKPDPVRSGRATGPPPAPQLRFG